MSIWILVQIIIRTKLSPDDVCVGEPLTIGLHMANDGREKCYVKQLEAKSGIC